MAAGSVLRALWCALRPAQWSKNVFVLAPLVFAQRIQDAESVSRAAGAFVIFCLLSSAVYLVNDMADREADRLHPEKKDRPLASGKLGVGTATIAALLLAASGLAAAMALGREVFFVGTAYLLVNLAYSFHLKAVVILDVMIVATGFILRAWSGALALSVEMSKWLVLCTGLIALFIALAKRRQELARFENGDSRHQPFHGGYSITLLDQMISVIAAATLLAYSLYAFSAEVAAKLGTHYMGLTLPFVIFGMFRYLYLIHRKGIGSNPTHAVLSDKPLLATVFAWGAVAVILMLSAA